MRLYRLLMHGALGGLIAGAVVALWFLAVDMTTGVAFMTPMVLGNAVFGGDFAYPSVDLLFAYSVLHFAAFAVLGAVAAWLLSALQVAPGLMVGMAFGLFVLSAFHYTGLLLGGVTAQIVLPPVHVLGSNLIAGMAFTGYLHRVERSDTLIGPSAVLQYPLARRGLAVGVAGAGAVAVWFLLLDVLTRHPFYTPAALGSALLLGVTNPAQVHVTPAIVAAYSALHLVVFIAVGTALAAVAAGLARAPGRALLVLMAFVVLEGMFVGTVGALASWVLRDIGWWAVSIGNVLAVSVMAAVVWAGTPELRERLRDRPVEIAV